MPTIAQPHNPLPAKVCATRFKLRLCIVEVTVGVTMDVFHPSPTTIVTDAVALTTTHCARMLQCQSVWIQELKALLSIFFLLMFEWNIYPKDGYEYLIETFIDKI